MRRQTTQIAHDVVLRRCAPRRPVCLTLGVTATLEFEPYQRVVAAAGLSNLADGIQLVALPLLVLQVTTSPLLVSAVIAANLVPWLVFGLWAGALTDRSDRSVLARRTALLRVVVLSALAVLIVLDAVPIALLLAAAVVLGTSEVLADNVNSALIPSLVPEADLERANSRMVGAEILGNELIGPAVGGLLFAAAAALPFVTNAGLLAAAFLLLCGLPLLQIPEPHEPEPAPRPPRASDGIAAVWASPLLRTITWSSGLLAAIDGAWFALVALLVTVELGLPPAALGVFLAIGAVGGLLGAAIADRSARLPLPRVAVAVFVSMAAPLVALAWLPNAVAVGLALAVTSGSFALWNVVMVSARQRASTPHTLGRIGAAHRTFVMAAALVGTLAGGLLAELLSIRATLVVSAIALCITGPAVIANFRRHAPA